MNKKVAFYEFYLQVLAGETGLGKIAQSAILAGSLCDTCSTLQRMYRARVCFKFSGLAGAAEGNNQCKLST